MKIVALLAKRFLTGKKRNHFLSLISGVSLFGVVVGVTALIVVMGVMEGFESTLRSVITGTHSHIVLYSRKLMITDVYDLSERVRRIAPNIESMSPYLFSEVMVAHDGRVAGSLLEGVEEKTIYATTDLKQHLVRGSFPEAGYRDSEAKLLHEGGIVIGSGIAEKIGADIGDMVTVISPFFDEGGLQPRSLRFRVSGITTTGMYEYDSKYSYVNASEARTFFKIPENAASAFKIKTKEANNSLVTARLLERELGQPYEARDWSELNRNLFYAIKLQKAVIFIVLTAIIIVAAFNIMSTLVMMMSEKKREMSILKAMGLKARDVAAVFVSVGAIIGIAGAFGGAALGIFLGQILAHTRFIQLPADVYFISYLPVDMRPFTLVLIMAVSIFVALAASIYPSLKSARESPVEGLRYE